MRQSIGHYQLRAKLSSSYTYRKNSYIYVLFPDTFIWFLQKNTSKRRFSTKLWHYKNKHNVNVYHKIVEIDKEPHRQLSRREFITTNPLSFFSCKEMFKKPTLTDILLFISRVQILNKMSTRHRKEKVHSKISGSKIWGHNSQSDRHEE